MGDRLLIILFFCIIVLAAGCTSKRGLVALETRPSDANVYIDGRKIGTTPVEFEYDFRRSATLKIEKEGYYNETEILSKPWVVSEYHRGNYTKGRFPIQGKMRKAWKVITTKTLYKKQE